MKVNYTSKQQAYRFGVQAERLCKLYLRLKGYRILAERLRTAGGEIDLLARRGNTLVIVEVKARATVESAMESITPVKQERLTRAALAVLGSKTAGRARLEALNIRFDVMAVSPRRLPRHITNAWRS